MMHSAMHFGNKQWYTVFFHSPTRAKMADIVQPGLLCGPWSSSQTLHCLYRL